MAYTFRPPCMVCGVVVGVIAEQSSAQMWCPEYRAIICDTSDKIPPYLSGVGLNNKDLVHPSPPCDRNAHYAEAPPPENIELRRVQPDVIFTDVAEVPAFGYLFHELCWDLLEKWLGPIPNECLTPLGNVLKARWLDDDFGGAKKFIGAHWGGRHPSLPPSPSFVANPWDVPEVNAMVESCQKQKVDRNISLDDIRGLSISDSRCPLNGLPQELRYLVLDHLELDDIRNVLSVLNWPIPDGYWKGRVRSDLFFEVQKIQTSQSVDWHDLWLKSETLLKAGSSDGLKNRKRIYQIIKRIRTELEQYQGLYIAEPLVKNSLDDWSVYFASTRGDTVVNTLQTMEIPNTSLPASLHICFYFAGKDLSRSFLSGIKTLPSCSKLGYVDIPSSSSVMVDIKSPIHSCLVKMDENGIRDIKLTYAEGDSGWIRGYKGDCSVGILFENDGLEATICAMLDSRQLTAIGSIRKKPRVGLCNHNSVVQRCLRSSALWSPDLPPVNIDLNEDQYTDSGPEPPPTLRTSVNYTSSDQPLRYILFGGARGELLGSLKTIKSYQRRFTGRVFGLEFLYRGHDSIMWGSKCEYMHSINIHEGEFVDKVRVDDKFKYLKIGTNRRRTFSVGDHRREKREKLPLIAGVRERIVGFYSGPYAFLNHRSYEDDYYGTHPEFDFGVMTIDLDS